MLKRLLFLSLFASSLAAAGLPRKMNFQGRLTDPATNNPRSGVLSMEFRMFDASTGGNQLWPAGGLPETQAVSVNNGVFAVQLGSVTALFPDIFTGTSVYLSVTIAPDVFPAGEMLPRQRLVMSPYAFTAAQLIQSGDIRINSGVTYSTFTTDGNLELPAGLTASTAVFSGTGAAVYSVDSASGILVRAGTLDVDGAGGVDVLNSVKAATFTGDGADLTNVRPRISSVTQTNIWTQVAAEVVLSSVSITPSRAGSVFLISTNLNVNRSANGLQTWTVRLRRNIGSVCTTGSTQVGTAPSHTVPNTAGTTNMIAMQKVDDPNTTSTVFYCLTTSGSSATGQTGSERNIIVMEAQ